MVRRKGAGKGLGRPTLGTVDLLREVYLANLRDGRALANRLSERLGADASSVRSALRGAVARKLVREAKGAVDLTPSGRRRLKVVMMGGAFEIIHPGHIDALSEARRLGNTLVVVVATDDSVERNKGRASVTGQALRVGLVSSLRQVDLALPGNRGSIYEILLKIRPDIVALGYDQRHSAEEIVREAARRGVSIRSARLGTTLPDLKSSKILLSL
jgi:cytidyltransferase-like protein